MKLFAYREPNNRTMKSLHVYDDAGLAYIKRVNADGTVSEWRSPDKTPAEWVECNNVRVLHAPWQFATTEEESA